MATQSKVGSGNALAVLRAALKSVRLEKAPPAGWHCCADFAQTIGRSERTTRDWVRRIHRLAPLESKHYLVKNVRVPFYRLGLEEFQNAIELLTESESAARVAPPMFGLSTIRAINAASTAKGKTDTATHVRVARNEKIKSDLARQRKGRTGQ